MSEKLKVIVLTQNDRFFIPKNILKASKVCEILEIVEVNSKSSLNNKLEDYINWFGIIQVAKMGFVTIGRDILKYIDRISRHKFNNGTCSVKDVADVIGVPHKVTTNSNDKAFVQHIKELNPDLIISYSAPQIIKAELLGIPKHGVINVHGSLLPDYRGCLPSFWYIYNEEKLGGATIHYMSSKIDDGPIIEQQSVDISDCKTMFQLMKKTKALGGELMVKAIQNIEKGSVIEKVNDTTQGRYFTWPTVEQARDFRAKGKKLI
jgi:methionyl-tRNA formyltransferase